MTPMRSYIVYMPSLWTIRYEVWARNKTEAIEKIRKREAVSSDSSEYERELLPEEWPWIVQYQKSRR